MKLKKSTAFNNIMLILTESCNLRCPYCYEAQHSYNESKTMSWPVAKKAVDLFLQQIPPEIEHSSITFFGGEPTLEFDLIKKVIDYTFDHRTIGGFSGNQYSYVINTNGTILTDSMIDFYKQLGPKINIRVSVDGYAENQNASRIMKNGQGSWDSIKKNLLVFRELNENFGVKVNLVTTISKFNYKNIYSDYTRLFEMAHLSIGFLFVLEQDWCEEDFAEIKRQVLKLHLWCIEHNKRFSICDIRFRMHTSDNICASGVTSFTVNPAGKIYPCHRCYFYNSDETYLLGDVENGISPQKREMMLDLNCIDRLPKECRKCSPILRGRCHVCFASNEKNSGNLYKVPPSFCDLTKDLHRLLTMQEKASGRYKYLMKNRSRTIPAILYPFVKWGRDLVRQK
jgi:uncharacterized protein